MFPLRTTSCALAIVASLVAPAACQAGERSSAAARVDFASQVLPLLQRRCFRCHQGNDASSGYRLDDRREILGETTGVPLAKPGAGGESRMFRLVTSADPKKRMPPEGKPLSAEEVGLLRAWIDQGLAWDETLLPPAPAKTDHWAFQSIRRPGVPQLQSPADRAWVRNPIDAFVRARQLERGLRPAPEAPRRTLVRRLSLDLLGVPPSLGELQALDEPYEELIERLLDSPHYGERWGRHWLDVARWAESEGYESNHPRPFAWRYRDYVVRSFNQDRPFDEFVRQQLAGDELVPYRDENLIATGFLSAARISSNEEDKWLQRNDVNVDLVNATASAFLGLTMNCAQCHNHKFDPISSRDYYRLQGYFVQGQPVDAELREPHNREPFDAQVSPEYEPAVQLREAIFAEARRRLNEETKRRLPPEELAVYEKPANERTVDEELLARKVDLKFQRTPKGVMQHIPAADRKLYDELGKKIEALRKNMPQPPQTFAYYSPVTSPHRIETLPPVGFYPLELNPLELERTRPYVKIRGDVHNIGPVVTAGWPAIFDTVFKPEKAASAASSRTALANWLTDPRHPLTARVWVNRIWHYHFGQGIVASVADFGIEGDRPTHPELLDWLAAELISSGWSTKHIQRLILTSATYRQSSAFDEICAAIDGENRYLWHWRPRRLENEALRDAMLAVTGELDTTLGGASVPAEQNETSTRRSLYLFQKRGLPPEMQRLFDGPSEASESCARRNTSTTALQSLYLLNGRFVVARAKKLAARLQAAVAGDSQVARRRRIERGFLLTLGRLPGADERRSAQRFLAANQPTPPGEDADGLTSLELFCQVLLNLNEFAYIE